jgi:copper(I)-binding protein
VLARRVALAAIAVAALATTSACAAGQHAMTAQESPSVDGTAGIIGALHLNAVAIKAPTTAASYPAGAAVQLQAAIVNTGTDADQLVGVSATGASGSGLYASLTDAADVLSPAASPSDTSTSASASASSTGAAQLSALEIPPGELTGLGLAPDNKALVLTGLAAPLYPGAQLTITFRFAKAGAITLQVPVQLSAGLSSPASVSAPAGESPAG